MLAANSELLIEDRAFGPVMHEFKGLEDAGIPFDFERNDINAFIIGIVPAIVAFARSAANSGDSYRGFKVGGAAVAYDPDPTNPRVAILTAANFKHKIPKLELTEYDVKEVPKLCAETSLLMQAEEAGYKRIGLLAVAATAKREKIAEVMKVPLEMASATLHPCDDACQPALKHSRLTDCNTPVITIDRGDRHYQAQTVQQLHKRHARLKRDGVFEDAEVHPFVASEWKDRQHLYEYMVKKRRLSGNVYDSDPRREAKRRNLAAWVITSGVPV
jgi:hypothetical protein